MFIAIPMMAMSRVYLGAHTLNEVLHGTLIGFKLAMIGHFYVKPFFLRLMNSYVESDEDTNCYRISCSSYANAFLFSFAVPMAIAAMTFYARYEDNESPLYLSNEWHTRMEKSSCDVDKLDAAIIMHYRHFEHSAIITVATGALFGSFFEA